jgi:hypothetical protein
MSALVGCGAEDEGNGFVWMGVACCGSFEESEKRHIVSISNEAKNVSDSLPDTPRN